MHLVPSHNLNGWWVIISWTPLNKVSKKFCQTFVVSIEKNDLEFLIIWWPSDWCLMASWNFANIFSANGLLPDHYQAFTWISADLLSLDPYGQISMKSQSKYLKYIWKFCLQNSGHFVQASVSEYILSEIIWDRKKLHRGNGSLECHFVQNLIHGIW